MADKPLDQVLLKLDTRHRVYDFVKSLGASDETAELIASSEQVRKFKWNGVALTWADTGKLAVDDAAAKAHFTEGPFKALFSATNKPGPADAPQIDPVLVEQARGGNMTARSKVFSALIGTGKGEAAEADAHGKLTLLLAAPGGNANGGAADSSNPFQKLRRPDGTIDKEVEAHVSKMIFALGTKKVVEIAAAAKSPEAPFGRSITGIPIRSGPPASQLLR